MKYATRGVGLGLFTAALLSTTSALAQVAPSDLPVRDFEDHVSRPIKPVGAVSVTAPNRSASRPAAPGAAFVLSGVDIQGNATIPSEAMMPLWSHLVGKQAGLDDLNGVAAMIEREYADKGLFLTRALVLGDVHDGIASIRVVEGFISSVSIEGDKTITPQIARAIEARLKNIRSAPATRAQVDHYVLVAQEIPGLTAAVGLVADPEVVGGAKLVVKATMKKFDGSVQVDNRGARYAGPTAATANAGVNSLLFGGDRLDVSLFSTLPTKEQKHFRLSYSAPVNSHGTEFRIFYSRANSRPGAAFEKLDIDSTTDRAGFLMSHPAIRSTKGSLSFSGGLTTADSKTDVLDFSLDPVRVRAMQLSVDGAYRDAWGTSYASLTWRQGLSGFGATDSFWVVQGDYARIQPIHGPVDLLVQGNFQITRDELPGLEQMSIGGLTIGRGTDPGAISAESGLAGRLELRSTYHEVPLDGFQSLMIQPYTFIDAGVGHHHDGGSESLVTGGFGVRFDESSRYALSFEVAKAVAGSFGSEDARVYARAAMKF
mgnify:FL=1